MEKLSICPKSKPPVIDLYIGRGLLKGDFLIELCAKIGHRRALICDAGLKSIYGEALAKHIKADLFTLIGREEEKTRETKQRLEDELFEKGYGADTVILGMGGGIALDVAGFVASTYLRGVPLVLIPTSLLAMVDGAIGNKTGVNTPYGKNQIGNFYYPRAIIEDLDLLKSLPAKEIGNGMAEVLKMGLVYDAGIWELAERHEKKEHLIDELIVRVARSEVDVIEQDPFEHGVRRVLIFGHVIGNAIEIVSHYSIPHGLAVAMGCLVESYLSVRLGYLKEKEMERIEALYREKGFPLKLPQGYRRKDVYEAFLLDKRRSGGVLRCVLIDRIGHAVPFDGEYCRAIPDDHLEAALAWMEKKFS